MKVFISQPMRGLTEQQIRDERTKYWNVIRFLLAEKLKVDADSIELLDSILKQNNTPTNLLAKSIEIMGEADIVVFLPNWQGSRGCQIEWSVANEYEWELRLRGIYTVEESAERVYLERR